MIWVDVNMDMEDIHAKRSEFVLEFELSWVTKFFQDLSNVKQGFSSQQKESTL